MWNASGPAEPPMPHQVFISYASADKATADAVCRSLEAADIACWIAPRDIEPGAHYASAIIDAINAAQVLVLVLSESARPSPHVLTELEEAFNRRKSILPFRLSADPLSKDLDYFLSLSQWLDAREGATPENLARLATAVRAALRGETTVPPPPPNHPGRAALFIALPLVLAAAGVAYWRWPKTVPSAAPPMAAPEPVAKRPVTKEPDRQARKKAAPEAGASRTNARDHKEYRWIPPGSFTMGCTAGGGECSPDELPAHVVEIEKGFWMAATEVTGDAFGNPGSQLPALGVSWAAAKAYCAKIGGRLPTEAEWEYAARGGKTEALYGPLPRIAWYGGNSGGEPHPAGLKAPNPYGLHDMLGNAAEWVLDRYYNRYDVEAPATGAGVEQPVAPNASASIRGGFWATPAANMRVSRRASRPPGEPGEMVGFRCVLDPR
jgi:formylglycine-generating enzyme required for sulfatase activity